MLLLIKYVLIITGVVAMILCTLFTAKGLILFFSLTDNVNSAITHCSVTHSQKCSERCNIPDNWQTLSRPRVNLLDTIWGSYKPGSYFGLKTATPEYSLSTGILWSTDILNNPNAPRHDVNQDELNKFEWQIHDGRHFGVEHLIDTFFGLSMSASFALYSDILRPTIVNGQSPPTWIQKFTLQPSNDQRKSLLLYFGVECSDAAVSKICLQQSELAHTRVVTHPDSNSLSLIGHSKLSGWFHLFVNAESIPSVEDSNSTAPELTLSYSGLSQYHTDSGLNRVRREYELVRNGARRAPRGASVQSIFESSFGDLNDQLEEDSKFIMFHAAFSSPTNLHAVLYEHIDVENIDELIRVTETLQSDVITKSVKERYELWSQEYTEDFFTRFNQLFHADSSKEVVEGTVDVARLALSSVLGGIGYFFGTPRVGAALDVQKINNYNNAIASASSNMLEPLQSRSVKSNIALLTGSPSRTAFPRGFLWDEGFHELLISEWDSTITMQVISDWLNAMHFPVLKDDESEECQNRNECVGGWIPREMILGDDATRRVPDEFVTQRINIANPPTFLLVLEKMLRRHTLLQKQCSSDDGDASGSQTCSLESVEETTKVLKFFNEVYPLLHQWINWFLVSQKGSDAIPGSFRWRGRSLSDNKVLPNTLASGLDDYPRSALPSDDEHHVDLHCWMITACQIMHTLETTLNQSPFPLNAESQSIANTAQYHKKYEFFLSKLDSLHWSPVYSNYLDVGLSGYDQNSTFIVEVYFKCSNPADQSGIEISVPVDVVRSGAPFCPESHPQALFPIGDGNGNYKLRERYEMNTPTDQLKLQHIPRLGYVSIFPLLLKHVSPSTPQFIALLDLIEDPNGLWTEHGLRSIAKKDKFYMKRNSAGDAPYWRGPIWININYLALSALHHYSHMSQTSNPHLERVKNLYNKLRDNIQRTVIGQYKETGYFWEQYEDTTGKGIKGHPFTGWTALIVNIITENY